MKSIILVQHCQSEHHVNNMTGGWTDTPLTELGRRQAACVASRLAREIRKTPCRLYSSDLKRAFQTAEIIGKEIGRQPCPASELREWNCGIATGKTKEWAERNINRDKWSLFDWRPFPQAETSREFHLRVSACMDRLTRQERRLAIVVAHGGTVSNIVAWWLRLDLDVLPERNPFAASPGSISVLRTNEYNRPVIERLNDTSHLDAAGLAGGISGLL